VNHDEAGVDIAKNSQLVLAQASRNCIRLRTPEIDTRHLLVALVDTDERIGSLVGEAGVDFADLRSRVEGHSETSSARVKRCVYSPDLKWALALSARAARYFTYSEIEPAHLLFGVINSPGGKGLIVLEEDIGADIAKLRGDIRRFLKSHRA
jgi:ATP-dependent Clp protease ATP-binding subunit ClpC